MAMSVSPGGRRAPGFCHNRRQGKRSAQKQIICPIYRGLASGRPYRLGLEPAFFAPARRMRHPQEVRIDSLLQSYLNTANLAGTQARRRLRRDLNFRRESRKRGWSRPMEIGTAQDSHSGAFALREPATTSLENALFGGASLQ